MVALAGEEPAHVNVLASGDQRLGQFGQGVEREVPRLHVDGCRYQRARLGAQARQARVRDDQPADLRRVSGRVSVAHPGADIMADEVDLPAAERSDELVDVLRGVAHVVTVLRSPGCTQPAQVGDDGGEPLRRQRGHDPVPGVGSFRPTVQQDDRRPNNRGVVLRPGGSLRLVDRVGQAHPVDLQILGVGWFDR